MKLGRSGIYQAVFLRIKGKSVNCYVHHLVLNAFTGPRPEGKVACHNDGNRFNNCSDNLRWDTYSNNNLDMVKHGRAGRGDIKGEDHPRALTTEKEVKKIRGLWKTGKYKKAEMARMFNMHWETMNCIITGRSWKHVT